ncbi:uncharacterized protein LOC119110920 isoform X2 [Pollicipes pollicipes]|uniref:uncharacterized protein LOC119110920 isoform X2 n=1 Tax=Pollicipes pollicipes TaxID=41117 RepID=UPI001885A127|nr:uncharacterized protein LOC119110920 isoform X2 [Pollicipes pollicipes]
MEVAPQRTEDLDWVLDMLRLSDTLQAAVKDRGASKSILQLFTTEDNLTRLEAFLRSPEVSQRLWKRSLDLPGLPQYMLPTLLSVASDMRFTADTPVERCVFATDEAPAAPKALPGVVIQPLHETHLAKVLQHWEPAAGMVDPASFFAGSLAAGLTAGVFALPETGAAPPPPSCLRAWALLNASGSIGVLHTEEAWRRRGYGTAVMATLSRACVELGLHPCAATTKDNAASMGTLRRVGYREAFTGVWLLLSPAGDAADRAR